MNAKHRSVNVLQALATGILLLFILAGCGESATATTAPSPPTATVPAAGAEATPTSGGAASAPVQVALYEWGIEPKELQATAGTQIFEVKNNGKFPHDLAIRAAGDPKTKRLAGGETEMLETTLAAGTYEIICSVPGHTDAGMVGTLVVK